MKNRTSKSKNDLRVSLPIGVQKLQKHGKEIITTLTKRTRRRIVNGLRNWDNPNSVARRRHKTAMKKHSKNIEAEKDAIARSEQPDRNIIVY